MITGKCWTVQDRFGNDIYPTHERWQHIIDPLSHPEMVGCEQHLIEAIQSGRRRQALLNPHKFRFTKAFSDLVDDNTHIVAIVLFRFSQDRAGRPIPNNYIVTAYQKEIG